MTESAATTSLADYVADWHPQPVLVEDTIAAAGVNRLAATLDLDQRFRDGDALPLLWQWIFFLDWPRTSELGPDGHPRDGVFLPPIPNRRRMFAGGRVTVHTPLRIGLPAQRHSEVAAKNVKHGRTGEMLFVTVRHTYRQDGAECITEEQDLVYRSDDGTSTPFARSTEPAAASTAPWSAHPHTHPGLLFRFSALTGNAHRIHYDEAYTTGVEGFPALVVHGPLLAVYMAELLRAHAPAAVARFEFRLQKPVFVGDDIRVEGTPSDSGVELAVVSGSESRHAAATAAFITSADPFV
jgi:3-methylfumaryl-CoA hydratase